MLSASFAGWSVRGAARIEGRAPGSTQPPRTELSIDFGEVEVGHEGSRVATAPSFRLHVEGEDRITGPLEASGSVVIAVEDTRPLLDLLGERAQIGEIFEEWFALENVQASVEFQIGEEGVRLDPLRIESGGVELEARAHLPPPGSEGGEIRIEELWARGEFRDPVPVDVASLNGLLPAGGLISLDAGEAGVVGQFEIEGDREHGSLQLRGEGLVIALRGQAVETDLAIDVAMKSSSLSEGRFDLAGTRLRLDGTRWLDEKGKESPAWWGELTVEQASVVMGRPLEIEGRVRLRLLDTRPVIRMLEEKSRVIHWFHRLLEIKDIEGTAQIHLGADGFKLDDVAIEGKGLEIEGVLDFTGDEEYVLLHARLHHLGVGVEILEGARHVRSIEPGHWYKRRLEAYRSANPL